MVTAESSAAERAYQVIRERILNGVYPTGTMLGEATLAGEIGVSRTPVRGALTRLQEEGWITIYPKRGALVQGLSDRAARDLADARFVLESASVQHATSQARRQLADRLVDQIAQQNEAYADRDVRRFIELTIVFHRSFVQVGGNEVLLELDGRLADRQRFRLFSSGDELLEHCAEVIAEHEQMVAALHDDDPDRFTAILRGHVGDTSVDAGPATRDR